MDKNDCYRNFILTMNEKSFTIGDKVIDGIVAFDADSEKAADLEEYKELVKSAIPEGDDADNTFMSWRSLKEGNSLRQEISKVIARELKTEDITYDELVLRLAFFLSGYKDTRELHRMVDYVKKYRESVGMSWSGKEES